MSLHHDHAEPSPKAPLLVIAGIAALSLALAASASFGLVERDAVPNVSRAAAGTQASAIRSLTFADASDGAVLIDDGTGGLCTRNRVSPYALASAGAPLAALSQGDYKAMPGGGLGQSGAVPLFSYAGPASARNEAA